MFRDEAVIEVLAGKGGDGLVSFRREKYVPRGGPDGGDGGDGGSVVLVATSKVHSLLAVGRAYRFAARGGRPGGTRKRSGRSGASIEVPVPLGTLVYDRKRGNLLRDLAKEGQRLEVARGGRGGRGNVHFATSVEQVPQRATKGRDGEERTLKLELKLFAEVGLIGFPNAGKSTFLSVVTEARPKIADYPFTTLDPQVGIATVGDYDTLVIADLPGLIEGASSGVGLGHRFLKHVERCAVLLHFVDVSEPDADDPVASVAVIEEELAQFSDVLAAKPRLLVATKVEDDSARARARALAEARGERVLAISSQQGDGIQELLREAQVLARA